MYVVFLDIDGVLNGHEYDVQAKSCTIKQECVKYFNVLMETNVQLVLSSAWRYQILRGATTLRGFEHLLQSHGCRVSGRLIGHTREDKNVDEPRAVQIEEWLNKRPEVTRYCVVDDMDLGFTWHGMPFVQTDGAYGINLDNVSAITEILYAS